MTYRTLITVTCGMESVDFVARAYDFGDMLKAKDQFIESIVHDGIYINHDPMRVVEMFKANPQHYYNATIGLMTFTQARDEWIKIYADRHYILNLEDASISSPAWSQRMDEGTRSAA